MFSTEYWFGKKTNNKNDISPCSLMPVLVLITHIIHWFTIHFAVAGSIGYQSETWVKT